MGFFIEGRCGYVAQPDQVSGCSYVCFFGCLAAFVGFMLSAERVLPDFCEQQVHAEVLTDNVCFCQSAAGAVVFDFRAVEKAADAGAKRD